LVYLSSFVENQDLFGFNGNSVAFVPQTLANNEAGPKWDLYFDPTGNRIESAETGEICIFTIDLNIVIGNN
jgi:hypothetical protein